MRFIKIFSFAAFISNALFLSAQDPEFSQFFANPLYTNPAFAGAAKCPRFVMNYRNQWPQFPGGNFVTYNLSYDQHVNALAGGVGASIMHDRAGRGLLNTTYASAYYSYLLNVTRKFSMKLAIQPGVINRSLDWDGLTFPDMIDDERGFVRNTNEIRGAGSKTAIDVGAGFLGYTDKIYFGAALSHINQPNFSLNGGSNVLPYKLTANAGAMLPLKSRGDMYISPNIIYRKQGVHNLINVGAYFIKQNILGGVWVRNTVKNFDAVVFILGYTSESVKFGYSYDLTVSQLRASGGAHELSLQWQLPCKVPKKKFKPVNCPSF
jgi:type IX secretion system PorP/SprF family membrane protein